MGYSEFLNQFRSLVKDFKKKNGRDPELQEFDVFVESQILRPRTKGLKSLKGTGI